jgi:hypothetical protein
MATNIDDAGVTFPDSSFQNAPTGIEDVIVDGTPVSITYFIHEYIATV